MTRIHQLPPLLVSKIAAGEVVERPASIIKELVENALDAQASHITIDIKDGGKTGIKISDNGIGMDKEDLSLCFKPHTTSKLSTEDQLQAIATYGFRGEALASITAVSDVTIKSRQSNQAAGNHIEISEHKVLHVRPVGMPTGTEIQVESLFQHIPARKKFLKDTKIELKECTDVVVRFSIAFPYVGFKYIHNSEIILNLPENDSLENRLRNVLGKRFFEDLIPIEATSEYGKVTGFIGKPQRTTKNRTHQYIFVNNRYIESSEISKAVKESFGTLLDPRLYPVFILFLDIPVSSVDVNIHPQKEEVAFVYHQQVLSLVQEAINHSFEKNGLTYRKNSKTDENYIMDLPHFELHDSGMDPFLAKELKALSAASPEIHQLNNLYLLIQTKEGLLLIDQHAAHERILFECYTKLFTEKKKKLEVLILEKPTLIELPIRESLLLKEQIPIFESIGFTIEEFGKNTFRVSSVPQIYKARDYSKIIIEVLHDLEEKELPEIDQASFKTLAYLACRSAVKAGDSLSSEKQKEIFNQLFTCENPYTCPHGRPTHILISMSELSRMFKRS